MTREKTMNDYNDTDALILTGARAKLAHRLHSLARRAGDFKLDDIGAMHRHLDAFRAEMYAKRHPEPLDQSEHA